ncbi:SagB family peptide dehydrogenase [Nocardia huaxiensis]|uniref:SagB family peptide dehydrogenase n=1 Tax=Nocardia huaxiensis TaxID=2755382 RepID=UPI001E4F3367|nr:SagB family peptide dehydrogenase [Nocardia huaxiensis]UFS95373.1 SagB family peptide dehydrogenase [Nocardia huaxiensis]
MSTHPEHTRYALRPGVTCLTVPGGAVLLNPPHKQQLKGLDAAQSQALKTLNRGPSTVADMTGDGETATVATLLDRLAGEGWLTVTVRDGDRDLYTLRPFATPPARPAEVADVGSAGSAGRPAGSTAVLSKFAVIHRDSDGIVLEHPTSWCDLRIHDPRLLALAGGANPSELGLPEAVSSQLSADLLWGGFAVADPAAEDATFTTRSWSAPDLWFHRRSTLGARTVTWDHFGPTKWAKQIFPAPPARRTSHPGAPITLPQPDLATLRTEDPTLTAVLEDRRSHRAFDDANPITLAQLAELLYRTARTRSVETTPDGEELPSRPYPSGGSVHELELYPVVRHVEGLPPGMYHYDSFDHTLNLVAPADSPAVQRLLKTTSATLAEAAEPQLALLISARAGRVMWGYEQVAYANILKHVGVLMQTVYLAATAMNLGAVAQGFSDTAAFTAATGVNELEECNVGCMIIGTPATR